jgi:hypothetical protein
MYKIIGDDQKEYGPVSPEALRDWIAQRRVIATTLVKAEDTDWKPLREFAEFADALAAAPPPPVEPARLSGAAPDVIVPPAEPPKTSGLAIASLVCGILGLCTGVTALVGLVLGIVALVKISKSEGRVGGKGLAIAGTCVSGCVTALMLIMIPVQMALLLPALSQAKSHAQTIMCQNQLKQQALAVHMYADDNDGVLPSGGKWCDALKMYLGGSTVVFHCPADNNPAAQCSYGFNARLSGLKLSKVNPATVVLFESNGGWNSAGGLEQLTSRHGRVTLVALADGSVQQYRGDPRQLRWDP